MKRVRTKKTVTVKTRYVIGIFHKIAAGARTRFTSAHKRRSARTGRLPRKSRHYSPKCVAASVRGGVRSLRAPRANRLFGTEMKRVRTKKTVTVKTRHVIGIFHKIAAGARTRFTSAH